MPHRPARRRRRAARPEAAARSPATRSSATWRRWASGGTASRSATAWACPGWAGPAAHCRYCRAGARTSATARASPATTLDGGYAEYAVADAALLLPAPRGLSATCRRRRCCAPGSSATARCGWPGDAERLGLYGFGAAAHIVAPGRAPPGPAGLRLHPPGRRGGAGVRPRARRGVGGRRRRAAAGARSTPRIIFAPAGALVPAALRRRGQGRHRSSAPAST